MQILVAYLFFAPCASKRVPVSALLPLGWLGTLLALAGTPTTEEFGTNQIQLPQPISPASDGTCRIEGWTVHVAPVLWQNDQKPVTEKALTLLQRQLAEIGRVVPTPALARLREVPLWFSPPYPGVRPGAEYHPGAAWLREHGRDPAMVKSVEFTNVRDFEQEMNRMPNFALHELAHAYHDRVLGFDHAEIKAAYECAKARHIYDRVERWLGNGRPNTFERAYSLTDPHEYFAECTEAFFGRNDFFPFTHAELEKHDPEMFQLLQRLWQAASLP